MLEKTSMLLNGGGYYGSNKINRSGNVIQRFRPISQVRSYERVLFRVHGTAGIDADMSCHNTKFT
mgnify:CR=1 FL=1